jgi:hypothetical protein
VNPRNEQIARLEQLQREFEELTASLPAHSVSPAMMIRLEDLEAQIADLQAALKLFSDETTEN